MRLLFTGFEPFGEVDYNPSWDCAQAAAGAAGAEARLLEVTLEGSWAGAEELGAEPTLVVHFGVAVGREAICLERYARNRWRDAGDAEEVALLDPDGADVHECPLPLEEWVDRLNDLATDGPRWQVSEDAGSYVCNATLYRSLAALDAEGSSAAVFVHVPPFDRPAAHATGATLGRWLAATQTSLAR